MSEKKLRCNKCDSAFVYVRIKDNTLVCRSCGYISELKEDEEEEKKEE